MEKILILNSGGTFNKKYNKLNGELIIDTQNSAIKEIISTFNNLNYELQSILNKDSLEITDEDRLEILKAINSSKCNYCLLIHGTDTMDITARFLKEEGVNKTVVITGSMIPFIFNKVEATANLSLSLGYLLSSPKKDVYIGMHGAVKEYKCLVKNRDLGQFEIQKGRV